MAFLESCSSGGVRGFVRIFLFRWFGEGVEGANERLQQSGGVIIAPTHRSNLDGPLIGSSSYRRVRYLGKDSLSTCFYSWLGYGFWVPFGETR